VAFVCAQCVRLDQIRWGSRLAETTQAAGGIVVKHSVLTSVLLGCVTQHSRPIVLAAIELDLRESLDAQRDTECSLFL
jgi:hypothetical protein